MNCSFSDSDKEKARIFAYLRVQYLYCAFCTETAREIYLRTKFIYLRGRFFYL